MSRPAHNGLAAGSQAYAAIFAALGDSTRLYLVTKLCDGQSYSISQLTETTALTRQAITKHLRVLEGARIVSSSRTGRENRFSFNLDPIDDLRTYLAVVSVQWDQALARLRHFVEA
ncbi:MAG: helix-turn-helix transcriptional regulator [Nitrosospira sp.]|nr:helix-turn-helix transcriptional regulator [Nitrosospira sp.]